MDHITTTVKGNTAASRASQPVGFNMDHEIGSNPDSDSQDVDHDGVVEPEEMIDLDMFEAYAITGERIIIS